MNNSYKIKSRIKMTSFIGHTRRILDMYARYHVYAMLTVEKCLNLDLKKY